MQNQINSPATEQGNAPVVIARWYVAANGQQCRELLTIAHGRYIIADNGRVNDARQWMHADAARAWYDSAAYQIGPRP